MTVYKRHYLEEARLASKKPDFEQTRDENMLV